MSHNLCAFPSCTEPLVEGETVVGELCHIKGERPGSARYDADQTDADRHGYGNLVAMCRKHHRVIDNEEAKYPVEKLLEMKKEHEESDTRRYVISDELVQRLGGQMHRVELGQATPTFDEAQFDKQLVIYKALEKCVGMVAGSSGQAGPASLIAAEALKDARFRFSDDIVEYIAKFLRTLWDLESCSKERKYLQGADLKRNVDWERRLRNEIEDFRTTGLSLFSQYLRPTAGSSAKGASPTSRS